MAHHSNIFRVICLQSQCSVAYYNTVSNFLLSVRLIIIYHSLDHIIYTSDDECVCVCSIYKFLSLSELNEIVLHVLTVVL